MMIFHIYLCKNKQIFLQYAQTNKKIITELLRFVRNDEKMFFTEKRQSFFANNFLTVNISFQFGDNNNLVIIGGNLLGYLSHLRRWIFYFIVIIHKFFNRYISYQFIVGRNIAGPNNRAIRPKTR